MAGTQFYLEMIDDDPSPPDELIDIIMVDLEPLPVTASAVCMNVTGVYGMGWMKLTFNAHCTQNFSGEFCTQNKTQINDRTTTEGEKGGVDVATVVAPTVVFTAVPRSWGLFLSE